MYRKLAALSFAMLSLSTAMAAQRIEATGLTLESGSSTFGGAELHLLSDEGGTVRIGLGVPAVSASTDAGGASEYNWFTLLGQVTKGYHVTSLTLSGVLGGATFAAPAWDPCAGCTITQGWAANTAAIRWSTQVGNNMSNLPDFDIANLQGAEAFSQSYDRVLSQPFSLWVRSEVNALATPTRIVVPGPTGGETFWLPGQASMFLLPTLLTLEVSPVPEPASITMLGAGLGLMGLLGVVRRSRAACARLSDAA